MKDLAVTMALFTGAVLGFLVIAVFAFKRWEKREEMRRGRQIAMAHLDPECSELPKREQ